jgi:hypothetical protein
MVFQQWGKRAEKLLNNGVSAMGKKGGKIVE